MSWWTYVLCALMVAAGASWSRVAEWARGGQAQHDVDPVLRGKHRHSIAYVQRSVGLAHTRRPRVPRVGQRLVLVHGMTR